MSDWIKCSERLPEQYQEVYIPNGPTRKIRVVYEGNESWFVKEGPYAGYIDHKIVDKWQPYRGGE